MTGGQIVAVVDVTAGEDQESARNALLALNAALGNTFADLHFTIEDTLEEGDSVAVSWTARGRYREDSPTHANEPATFQGIDIFQIVDGQISRRWGVSDLSAALRRDIQTSDSDEVGGYDFPELWNAPETST